MSAATPLDGVKVRQLVVRPVQSRIGGWISTDESGEVRHHETPVDVVMPHRCAVAPRP